MSANTHAAEIQARGITKKFGSFTALNDVSITVDAGEFLTLLGPSGSGKTTLLMTLAGFELPTQGSLFLNGQDVTHVPPEDRQFGMVFQGYALFPHMSVEQNIAFPLKVQRRSRADVKRLVTDMIEMVGLNGHERKKPAALSGGQQQRVALARALVSKPAALLLDEPFSALDKNLREQMQEEMRRLHRETGTSFVFVTHDQSEALALSTRVAIFDHGKLQQIGTPRRVYEQPDNRFVAEFLGDVNLLPLSSSSNRAGITTGLFEGHPLTAPCAQDGHQTNGDVLAVRPEYMQMMSEKPHSGNFISAQVVDTAYFGAQTRLDLKSDSGVSLTLSSTTATLPQNLSNGERIWIAWPEDRGFILKNRAAHQSESFITE